MGSVGSIGKLNNNTEVDGVATGADAGTGGEFIWPRTKKNGFGSFAPVTAELSAKVKNLPGRLFRKRPTEMCFHLF